MLIKVFEASTGITTARTTACCADKPLARRRCRRNPIAAIDSAPSWPAWSCRWSSAMPAEPRTKPVGDQLRLKAHESTKTAYSPAASRCQLFGRTAAGIGTAALASLLNPKLLTAATNQPPAGPDTSGHGTLKQFHLPPKAKRVIYLHMAGGPSHIDLLDYKPQLQKFHGQELPASVRMGQRITGMTSGQKSFPCVAPMFKFAQHGRCGAWMSELLPHTSRIADDIAIVKSMHTEAINHDPAITYIQTGSQQPGRPSLGSWLSYGLGSENQNLPAYIVMISLASNGQNDQPLFSRLWGSGFLPSQHQGVRFRSGESPVLYLHDPTVFRPGDTPRNARRPGRSQPPGRPRAGRSRDQHPHRAVRNGLPHADVGARADGSLRRNAPDAGHVRAGRVERRRARMPATAC